jgi:hypothetical protein
MRGKWAQGIEPRNFAWIIKDKLAVSERPGGYARNHRKVRRQEEIIWLREQGFTRVVSLLTSTHNLHAYEELSMPSTHIPLGGPADEVPPVLVELYTSLRGWMAAGERILLHQEELGDRLAGVVAGYLLWAKMLDSGPQAIAVIEQIVHKQMGPAGREIVALVPGLS